MAHHETRILSMITRYLERKVAENNTSTGEELYVLLCELYDCTEPIDAYGAAHLSAVYAARAAKIDVDQMTSDIHEAFVVEE